MFRIPRFPQGRLSRPVIVAVALYSLVGSVAGASLIAGSSKPVRQHTHPAPPPGASPAGAEKCPVTGKSMGNRLAMSLQEGAAPAAAAATEEEAPDKPAENIWEVGDRDKMPEPGKEDAYSGGCVSCHRTIEPSHRPEIAAEAGSTCVNCHGGNGRVMKDEKDAKNRAHVHPRYPEAWGKWKNRVSRTGNPERTYTLLNQERPEFIRFINPGDLRIAHLSCGQPGGCHSKDVLNSRKSMMTHGAMLYEAALYNNGAIPVKDAVVGESYSFAVKGKDGRLRGAGVPQRIQGYFKDDEDTLRLPTAEETRKFGWLPLLEPFPRWEISQVGNIFRVFERGGFKRAEIGNPLPEEESGRPDVKLSDRGHGTLLRTDPTVLGAQKTRLLDPTLNFLGTNDQPGDYHSSGCTSCHNVYANDRDPKHSGHYSKFEHTGTSATGDDQLKEAVAGKERGHPISHTMTSGIPTSQCISCHIHPGTNMEATYLGYTWWDNETDGDLMYPKEPVKLSSGQKDAIQQRNPEGAALKGKWGDPKFLENVTDLNPKLKHTQFGDFHSHGWVFRKVFKQDRKGNLLDAEGNRVPHDDPEKFQNAVHLQDIHLAKGMHCVDCHFKQDNHGTLKLYGETRAAIEITCTDCHGTVRALAALTKAPTEEGYAKGEDIPEDAKTSGVAGGTPFSEINKVWAQLLEKPAAGTEYADVKKKLFRWYTKKDDDGNVILVQRSAVRPEKEWEIPQVRYTITPGKPGYSERSRLSKTMQKDGKTWGLPADNAKLAHGDDNMTCFACHSSWTTACFGCHLQMTANQKKPNLHSEGGTSRNWTSYNYQTLRDDLYMLGRDGTVTGNKVAPVRSSCAVLVSSQNLNRNWIYYQQQTVSGGGLSGTAFSSYVPHTVRGRETKQCADCHVAKNGDNNAWLANLMLLGTNSVNFIGRYAYVGTDEAFQAVPVAERDEPAAVIGSYLHKLAYPDRYASHLKRNRVLHTGYEHEGKALDLQLRGEYLYAAEGEDGLRVYDVANIDNKDFSERTVTAPVSPLGQKFYVNTKYAAAVASPSTMLIDPGRAQLKVNEEGPIHPLYRYLYVADREEGLILVDALTIMDGNPTNNFLKRALTWNPDGVLKGASSLHLAGRYAYVTCDRGLVIVDLDQPLKPRVLAQVGEPALRDARACAVQFRYAFVLDADGMKVLDVTDPSKPRVVTGGLIRLEDARRIYLSRTYAYVAAGRQGLAILDVESPEHPKVDQFFTAEGKLDEAHDVKVGMTNNSMFAYVADGENGLRVIQLTSPETTPGIYGYSPRPTPQLIATYRTKGPALAVSEGLDRDRAVDESGNQLSVFGRRGARPFNAQEMRRMLFTNEGTGPMLTVSNQVEDYGAPQGAAAVNPHHEVLSGACLGMLPLALFALARRRRR